MTVDLFDRHLRAIRRDRAARTGVELVLFERAFGECLDRLRDVPRDFGRALLLGCPSPDWRARLQSFVRVVDVVDPGGLFATSAGGEHVEEDLYDFGSGTYDLCVAIGTLDTVNDLPTALRSLHRALLPDALLIGAIAGGNSLATLRSVLIDVGRRQGRAVARTHPRIEPSTLSQLLSAAGFAMPVVDVDRVRLRYRDVLDLVRDLRGMAATSLLARRPPPMTKSELLDVRDEFIARAEGERTDEIVEILHFLGWTQ